MVTNQNNLFRKEALEKVASPEQLDQLIKVTSPKRWFSLFALGALVISGAAWSVLGEIPIVVTGKGVLVYPSQVATLQASNSGRILELKLQAGDKVKKGEVIATIDQTELRKQLQLSREKLTQLKIQDQTASTVQTQRSAVEETALAQQRQTLQQSLETVQSLTPVLREKGLEVIKKERANLRSRLAAMRELQPTLKQRWEERQKLFQQGAVPKDTALSAQQEYINSKAQIDEAESQLNQLDVKEADAQRQYLQNLNQVSEIQAQLKALDSRKATQKEQDFTSVTNRKKEIQETERLIAQLESQLQKNSQVKSDYTGTVLELTAKPGQQLEPGVGIGTVSTQQAGAKLVNIVFLPVSENKKIKLGTPLQITPSTVKREEYGGIEAKVTKISEFPVTQQGVASIIGNPDILPGVLERGPQIAVYTEPEIDPSTPSGYKWSSSRGPQSSLAPGTTTTVRITIEKKKPIEFVLPILKSWTGN
ncbi:HlyD family secretion protein [Calothrix sp. NIES-4071]|nr:HlyD family secretion protein [Calothrix sp. NIES-4071]BAZ55356.1 HlyD family secretion protein [Calothrix sp. NIES-4105]